MIDINQMNELHAAATRGDWQRCQSDEGKCPCGLVWDANEEIQITVCSPQPLADAMWITESHNAWPAVAAELAAARDLIEEMKHALAHPLTPVACPLSQIRVRVDNFCAGMHEPPDAKRGDVMRDRLALLEEFERRVREASRFRSDTFVAGAVLRSINWLDAEIKKAMET